MFRRGENEDCCLHPMASTFTDDCGQFVFGPIEPETDVVIKIWANGACMVDLYR